jgi:predicted CXXCH cytochrome family protein
MKMRETSTDSAGHNCRFAAMVVSTKVRTPRRRGTAAMPITVLFAAMFCFLSAARAQNANSIIYTKHNLSVSSPGTIHATTEFDVCIFCHAPHRAYGDGPLWNHQMSSAVYKPYFSSTLKAAVGQPTGSSRLCLSCHDGTVALGSVHARDTDIAMNASYLPEHTDLSGDHPISFVYDQALATADGNLRAPNALPPDVHLDSSSQMQCTSCHDPHNNQFKNFLVMDNTGSALCLACHNIIKWPTSVHATSGQALPSSLASAIAGENNPRSRLAQSRSAVVARPATVASAGCASCHVSHGAGIKQQLSRFSRPEQNCISCHNGENTGQNLAAEFNKASVHPIFLHADSHAEQEDAVNPPVRHVTCVDCHNPHASAKSPGTATRLAGALAGVAGVNLGGSVTRNVSREYELCFRCHGDSAGRGPARVTRQFVETNTRHEFNPGNTSFHPIEAIGKAPTAPSLLQPLTAASLMTCEDCHNNDQGPGAGGTGPRGPHGSAYVPLLERMLLLTDGSPYNPGNFALCYKCHSSLVVDSDQSTSWSLHRKHIENDKAACTTCHDSHGATQPHLINFNTTYVSPSGGQLSYISTGVNHGVCTLSCHGHDHKNTTY